MIVVHKKPGEWPEAVRIQTVADLYELVGGYPESAPIQAGKYPLLLFYCRDRRKDLRDPNVEVLKDPISGPVVITAYMGEGKLRSLKEKEMSEGIAWAITHRIDKGG